MKEMIILRGVSGSGKSELAQLLLQMWRRSNEDPATICSADQFFGTSDDYRFNPKQLGQAHAWCQNKAFCACNDGLELVVIDNTNTQRWEFQPYMDMAEEFGYRVTVIEVQGNHQNIHQVPEGSIQKQRDRFQHDWWNHPKDK